MCNVCALSHLGLAPHSWLPFSQPFLPIASSHQYSATMSQSVSQGTSSSGDKRGTPSGSDLSGGSASKAPRTGMARFLLKVTGISGDHLAVPGLGAGSQKDPSEYAALFGTGGDVDVAPIALLAPVRGVWGGAGVGVCRAKWVLHHSKGPPLLANRRTAVSASSWCSRCALWARATWTWPA